MFGARVGTHCNAPIRHAPPQLRWGLQCPSCKVLACPAVGGILWCSPGPGWHFRIRYKNGPGLLHWDGGKFAPLQWHADPGRVVCQCGVYVTGGREAVHLAAGRQAGAEGYLASAGSIQPCCAKYLANSPEIFSAIFFACCAEDDL